MQVCGRIYISETNKFTKIINEDNQAILKTNKPFSGF